MQIMGKLISNKIPRKRMLREFDGMSPTGANRTLDERLKTPKVNRLMRGLELSKKVARLGKVVRRQKRLGLQFGINDSQSTLTFFINYLVLWNSFSRNVKIQFCDNLRQSQTRFYGALTRV